jgi:hypothetical protein
VSAGLSQWDESRQWRAKLASTTGRLRRALAFSAEMANCLADTIATDHLHQGL